MTDLASAVAGASRLAQDARAIVAALGAEDDPTLRERVDRVLDRVTKIEESIALLMDADVDDVPLTRAGELPADTGIIAGLPPQFLKHKKGSVDGAADDEGAEPEPDDETAEKPASETKPEATGDAPETPASDGEPQRTPKGVSGEEGPAEVGPIDNVADLHNAIRGFASRVDKAASKRYIKQRARELGAEDDLPDTWE